MKITASIYQQADGTSTVSVLDIAGHHYEAKLWHEKNLNHNDTKELLLKASDNDGDGASLICWQEDEGEGACLYWLKLPLPFVTEHAGRLLP